MAKKFKNLQEKENYYFQEHEKERKRQNLSRIQYYQIADRPRSGNTPANKYSETIREKIRKDEQY